MEENKKKSKKLFVLKVVLICVAVIAVGGYCIFAHYYGLMNTDQTETVYTASTEEEEAVGTDSPEETIEEIEAALEENLEEMKSSSNLETDSFNIMIIGVDSREDDYTGRSDAMILVSVNKSNNSITLTSFLRDIYVSIPGYGSNRLNAAYEYGGADLLKSTLEANFGISFDKYVIANFYSVMDIVDLVGGVDLEITDAEMEVLNDYVTSQNKLLGNAEGTDIINTSGAVHLNGNQALAYSRIRYVGTDFARTGRQRQVIQLVYDKVKEMSLLEIFSLMEEFLPNLSTNLSQGDCASLLLTLINSSSYTMNSMSIPIDGTWSDATISGMAVLSIDFQTNVQTWSNTVNGS